jgi:hypothetical protein
MRVHLDSASAAVCLPACLPVPPAFQLPGTDAYLANNTMWNFAAVGSPSAIFVPSSEEELGVFIKFHASNGQRK